MSGVALREKDLTILKSRFRRFPSIRQVRVFGSRATGHSRRASDLDLAISAPALSASEWSELRASLEESPLIYELDLVRAEQTTNERLQEKIAREGVTVFPIPASK